MGNLRHNLFVIALLVVANGLVLPLHLAIDHASVAHASHKQHDHSNGVEHLETFRLCCHLQVDTHHEDHDTHAECCPEKGSHDHSASDHQLVPTRARNDFAPFFAIVATSEYSVDIPSVHYSIDSVAESPPDDTYRAHLPQRGPPTA